MASYNDTEVLKNKLDWSKSFNRSFALPLDRSSIFSTYDDAVAYAKGDGNDSRKLGGTSYIGQILTVYENDTVNVYVINQNRTLTKLASGGSADEIAQRLEAEIARSTAEDTKHSNAISTITDVTLPALKAELSVTVTESAGSGDVLKSYSFKQGDVALGTIDIPKDFLVKSASVKECTEADKPIAGLAVGDKYLDFVLNTKDSTGTDGTHIYVNLKDLTDVYTDGNTATISVNVSNDNVITAELIENSVGTDYIVDGAVTTDKINGKAVTTEKIADLAVTTDKIKDGNVTEAKLATDSVTTGKIANDAVTNDKIAANAVHGEQIYDGAVSSTKIADGAVTTNKIANENVTEDKLATNSVTNNKLATNSVTTDKIKDANVTESKIDNAAVTTAKIADGNITTAKLSSDVTAYIAKQLTDANAYTDDAINKLIVDDINIDANSVIRTISETAGKIVVTASKIQIETAQVTGLDDELNSFVKKADFSQTTEGINGRLDTVSNNLGTLESTVETISSDYLKAADKTELNNAITTEAERAKSVEGELTALTTTDKSNLVAAINSEVTRATAAEGELRTAIGTEKSRAEEAEGTLQAAITAEVARAKGAESELQKNIDAEESRAKEVESKLRVDVNKANSTLASFATLSANIGLSAASSTNKVVTQQDIAALTNTMHFIGVTTTALSTGSTDNPIINGSEVTTLTAGDIVLGPDAKEFIWDGTQWHEIGKEGIYATSAELEAEEEARADADAALQKNIEDEAAAREAADETLQNNITAEAEARIAADAVLSGAIDNKVYVNGLSVGSLSVVNIAQEDYHDLVNEQKIDPNTVYIVSADNYNMYGQKIVNLADPTDDKDAATKQYVDQTVASGALTSITLNGQAFTIENNAASLTIETISCGGAKTFDE